MNNADLINFKNACLANPRLEPLWRAVVDAACGVVASKDVDLTAGENFSEAKEKLAAACNKVGLPVPGYNAWDAVLVCA